MSILVASRERNTFTTKTLTYNSASQLTNTGYVYDGLGRNTSIPAAHSPNSVGVIGLSYKVTDQVASITQSGVSTVYGFDAVGRRVTETTGGSVLTKHYTASSDNPAWSSNNAGVTDFYVNSLGTGLNGTVHVDNGVKTVSLDVNDMRGSTVTRINLDTATTDSWVSFDEYGNRDTASTGKLVTYDAYGQYERATTSQGLVLMGARVYNPVTNQFTSPDPVTGGNETSYTYPNDPINKNDFTGALGLAASMLLDRVVSVVSFGLGLLICGFLAIACQQVVKFVITFIVSSALALMDGKDVLGALGDGFVAAAISLIPGMSKSTFKKIIGLVKTVSKKAAKLLKKIKLKKIKSHLSSALSGWEIGSAIGAAIVTEDFAKELIF